MLNANQDAGSNNMGSPAADPVSQSSTGESALTGQDVMNSEAYKALESKLGSQGNELGEYRAFVENLTPLLERLDANPELVKAIVEGKITKEFVSSVMDGSVSMQTAEAVTQASTEVQQEVGQKKLDSMTLEQIEALVTKKTEEIRKGMEKDAELKEFETSTQSFIESTPDFIEYAEEIDKWLDTHNVADIEVAYWAVKGQMSASEAKKAADEAAAEGQKAMMMNAGGGNGYATTAPDGTPLIDTLVGGPSNPMF